MFGANNVEKLVKKKKWDKLRHMAEHSDKATLLQIAEHCGAVKADEAYNILVNLLEHPDEAVRIAAVRALGHMGKETAATHIRRIMALEENTSEACTQAIHAALAEIKKTGK